MQLLMFLLISFGLTNVIVNESVFEKYITHIKESNMFLNGMLSCPTCFGFWAGMIVYAGFMFPITGLPIDCILAGLMSSGVINIIEFLKIKE